MTSRWSLSRNFLCGSLESASSTSGCALMKLPRRSPYSKTGISGTWNGSSCNLFFSFSGGVLDHLTFLPHGSKLREVGVLEHPIPQKVGHDCVHDGVERLEITGQAPQYFYLLQTTRHQLHAELRGKSDLHEVGLQRHLWFHASCVCCRIGCRGDGEEAPETNARGTGLELPKGSGK